MHHDNSSLTSVRLCSDQSQKKKAKINRVLLFFGFFSNRAAGLRWSCIFVETQDSAVFSFFRSVAVTERKSREENNACQRYVVAVTRKRQTNQNSALPPPRVLGYNSASPSDGNRLHRIRLINEAV